jgi:hypothetical protein
MDESENINTFLGKVGALVAEAAAIREEEKRRGERFNVFNILDRRTDEVKTHSAIIRELLSPKGDHGAGTKFLEAFIAQIPELNEWGFETDKATAKAEVAIGKVHYEKNEGGRIDIAVENSDKLIIIENKIYADDEPVQLKRYNNYAKKRGKDYKIIYLTLDGHEASDDSGKGVEYIQISYHDEIIDWIEKCIEIAKGQPLVSETLKQYNNLLKELTGKNMNKEQQDKLTQLMVENTDEVISILNGASEWKRIIINDAIKGIAEAMKKEGMECELSRNFQKGNDAAISFSKPEWKEKAIVIKNQKTIRPWYNFYIGIGGNSGHIHKYTPCKKLLQSWEKPNEGWPYGFKFLRDEFRDWDRNVMKKMRSGEFEEYIVNSVKKILNEIEEQGIEM